MGFTSSTHTLATSNVKGQHARTATQRVEDMERHLESLRKLAEEEANLNIGSDVDLHKLKSQWLWQIRNRAKQKNVPCNLTIDDLVLPEACPILGMDLRFNKGGHYDNSYSLDRIDNTLGYTKDNVQVISLKANILKNKGTLEDLIKLGEWAAKRKALLQEGS